MNEYVNNLLREEHYNSGFHPRILRRLSESGNDQYGYLYNVRLESIKNLNEKLEALKEEYEKEQDEEKKKIIENRIRIIETRLDKITKFGYDFINYRNRYPFLQKYHEELSERFLIKYYEYRIGYNTLEMFSYKLRALFDDIAPEYENRLRIQAMYEKQILESDGSLKEQEYTDLSKSITNGNTNVWVDSTDHGNNDNWGDGGSSVNSNGWTSTDGHNENDNWSDSTDKGENQNWGDTTSETTTSFFNEQKPDVKRKSDENDGKVNSHSSNAFNNLSKTHNSNTSKNHNDLHTVSGTENNHHSHTSQTSEHKLDSHTSNVLKNSGLNENLSLQTKIKNIISGYEPKQNILREYLNEFRVLFIRIWSDDIRW